MQQTIPVVDLRSYEDPKTRPEFVQTYGDALKALGFVAIEHYGIEQQLFDDVYDVYRRFFALSDETKKAYERAEDGRQRGYTSFGVEHAKDSAKPDLKEFYHVGREVPVGHPMFGRLATNVWPEELPELRVKSTELFAQLDRVASICLAALGEYLGEDSRRLVEMAEGGNTVQRIIHYPVCDGFDEPGVMRAAQHEDINMMTLLPPADESGLEILTRDGKWLPVHAIPGQIVADTGDMMMRLTNDTIPATTHRVVNPVGEPKPRYSMPFFIHPHLDAMLEVLPSCVAAGEQPRYEPIHSEAFLNQRLREIGVRS